MDELNKQQLTEEALEKVISAPAAADDDDALPPPEETIELSDGSAIRLSTKSYLTPNRVDISTQGGVVPDMILYNSDPSTAGTTQGTTGGEQGTASVSSDEQLMAALTFLSKSTA